MNQPGQFISDSLLIFWGFFAFSCMIVSAETPHLRLRDKTLTVSYVISFACEFGVGFSLPYLLYTADLQSKVGFIYGAIAALGILWSWFYLPETSGRSLEEMEELWQEKVPSGKFGSYVTKSTVGLRITQLERHAGAGDATDSSEEHAVGHDDDDIKEGVVYHEEVIVPKKE